MSELRTTVRVTEVNEVCHGRVVTVIVASFLLCEGIKFVALGCRGVEVDVPAAAAKWNVEVGVTSEFESVTSGENVAVGDRLKTTECDDFIFVTVIVTCADTVLVLKLLRDLLLEITGVSE